VHSDVGGGYAEAESGLSKIALDWMLQEAKAAGLLVLSEKEKEVLGVSGTGGFVLPNPQADPHESLKGFWNVAEFTLKKHYNWEKGREERRMNLYRRRTIPPGALVHDSASQRGGTTKSDFLIIQRGFRRSQHHLSSRLALLSRLQVRGNGRYGHTGPDVRPSLTITQEQASALHLPSESTEQHSAGGKK